MFDPWNGSGTTTTAAANAGLESIGHDLNPVMLVVAKARLLASSEAHSLRPLAKEILASARRCRPELQNSDPLLYWFDVSTASLIRSLEYSIRRHLIGGPADPAETVNLGKMSSMAATFYVALFSLTRRLLEVFGTSNPTWTRLPKENERLVSASHDDISEGYLQNIFQMSESLLDRRTFFVSDRREPNILMQDSAEDSVGTGVVDMVLTSPPYCTRIDYSAATRIELAILSPLVNLRFEDLGRRMLGSTRVQTSVVPIDTRWGDTCNRFLSDVRSHPSKASSGYYLKTHIDYFDKMFRSLSRISSAMKPDGRIVLVVQDSYYKDVHNDVPKIISEMLAEFRFSLKRRDDFLQNRSISSINTKSRVYPKKTATEAVMCFAQR